LQQVEIGGKQGKSFGSNGIFKPPIERIFTNGERLRRRISSSVLFVLIRDIRGSNNHCSSLTALLSDPEVYEPEGRLRFGTARPPAGRSYASERGHPSPFGTKGAPEGARV
jgi:hypothetical protein